MVLLPASLDGLVVLALVVVPIHLLAVLQVVLLCLLDILLPQGIFSWVGRLVGVEWAVVLAIAPVLRLVGLLNRVPWLFVRPFCRLLY